MVCEGRHVWFPPFRCTQPHGKWTIWRRCARCGVVGLHEVAQPPEGLLQAPDVRPLTIHPDYFMDFADKVAANLMNRGVISTGQQYEAAVASVVKDLQFQSRLHETWQPGDEETSVRMLMDGRGDADPR